MKTEVQRTSAVKYLVVKIASRCNINCTYCYMFNKGDETFKSQPKVMDDKTVDALLANVLQHCQKHELKNFLFCFHGGEPLLAGETFLKKFVSKGNALFIPAGIEITYSLQTNGILLTEKICKLLNSLHIYVSISLDGDKETNDQYRIDHKGKGTYDRVVKGMQTMKAGGGINAKLNVLSVINVNADPVKVYEHAVNLGLKNFDLLLPDAFFDSPPTPAYLQGPNAPITLYADWLIQIFDLWFTHKGDSRPGIRLFKDLVNSMLGGDGSTDALGSTNNQILVIETNGGIEAVDVLKICGNGFTKNDANVQTVALDDVFQEELIDLYYYSHEKLCGQCLACPIKAVCGGGYLPHRYSSENGFDNPSIYCKDLIKLITHIQNRVMDGLPPEMIEAAGIERFTFQEVAAYVDQNKGTSSPYTTFLRSFKKSAPAQAYQLNVLQTASW